MKRKHGLTPMQRIERRRTYNGACWEVSISPNKVYPQLKIAGRDEAVHRVVFEHLVGPIPTGLYVLHRCDNPRCHNPEHLYLGTQSQNMEDMWARGRHKKPSRRIDEVAVLSLAGTLSQKDIANRVGATQTAISAILRAHGASRGRHTSFGKASRKKVTVLDR